MNSKERHGRGFLLKALALALGSWVVFGSAVAARGGLFEGWGRRRVVGAMGYGGNRVYPGYYGFGLKFHPGYGYGGHALGVGANGGFPFYGGPGYPHPNGDPRLNRLGPITPFPYYGGPGRPCPGLPLFYQGIGGLAVDPPVIASGDDHHDINSVGGFGPFTGAIPYPESFFAPYASEAAGSAGLADELSSSPLSTLGNTAPGASEIAKPPAQDRSLGIDEEQVVDVAGSPAMKVSKIQPGSPAEKAGLQPGDVILSINGYLTKQRGNLAWIIANAAPNDILHMNVRTANDGKEHTISVLLPIEPVNTTRPAPLPPVGNGPPPGSR